MTLPPSLPPELIDKAKREFAGEGMQWAAQPTAGRAFLSGLWILIVAVPWTAFALFWTAMAAGFGTAASKPASATWMAFAFPLFGVPFILFGLAMLSSPFWMAWLARRTIYVVSDRRLAILTQGLRSVTVKSIWPQDVISIERTERGDGSGTLKLIFGSGRDSDGDPVEKTVSLDGVPEVKKVEAHLSAMKERARR